MHANNTSFARTSVRRNNFNSADTGRRALLTKGLHALIGVSPLITAAPNHFGEGVAGRVPSPSSGGGLAPYEPRPEKPWNVQRVRHLLWRTGFGATWGDIQQALDSTPAELVETMLQPEELETNVFYWADLEPFGPDEDKETTANLYGTWTRLMQLWWLDRMTRKPSMLREKMVLFWHNHFVSEVPKVEAPQYMFMQNQLFRQYAFGDFRDLTRQITIDPAMLIYLDGATSRAESPNENYARELLELFTLGAGSYTDGTPHYSEHDIVEIARALTGWTVNKLLVKFNSDEFDATDKTIFGESGNFGVGGKTPLDTIDIIFRQVDRDVQKYRAAVFICTKLYRYFVSEVIDSTIVTEMAQTLQESAWNIGAVLRQLLTSEHFFDEANIGALIKSPVEFVIGSIHELGLQFTYNPDPGDPPLHDPLTASTYLSQQIMFPPNVKGWHGGRAWITMASLPMRSRYTNVWVEQVPDSLPFDFNPVGFIESFPDSDDVEKVLDHLLQTLTPIPISSERRQELLNILLGGAPPYEWNPKQAESHIRACIAAIGTFGEYQIY